VLGIAHHMGREGVERKEISHLHLLLTVLHLSLTYHVGVHDLVSRQEVVFHLFVRKVELYHIFPKSTLKYESPSLSSLATQKTSLLTMGLNSSVNSSGIL